MFRFSYFKIINTQKRNRKKEKQKKQKRKRKNELHCASWATAQQSHGRGARCAALPSRAAKGGVQELPL